MREPRNPFTIRGLCLGAAALLSGAALNARIPLRYDRYESLNLWNAGRNEAGIRLRGDTLSARYANSYAEVYGGWTGGGFRESWEAPSCWHAGATARTVVHLPELSMRGSFSFDQRQGRNMSGSMFIHPGLYPVDMLEFTPGTKTLQTYSMKGGIAVPAGGGWTLGARLEFTSANYSKRKDIRHTNYALDLSVLPSVTWRSGGWTTGLSLLVRKTGESIKAEQIGTAAAASYYAFLDKGLGYGVREVWDGSGVHLNEAGVNRFPVKEHAWGAAAQVQRSFGGVLSAYAEAEYVRSAGTIGERGFLWYRFPGKEISFRTGGIRRRRKATHILTLSGRWQDQTNHEYVTEKISEGGVTTPRRYGSNRIFQRRRFGGQLRYRLDSELWEADARAEWTLVRMRSSLVYPHSVTFEARPLCGEAGLLRHLGNVSLGAGGEFACPAKPVREIRTGDGAVTAPPSRLQEEFEIRKDRAFGPLLGGNLSVRYDFSRGPLAGLYGLARVSLLYGPGWSHSGGKNRTAAVLKIGYSFGN